MKYRDWIASVVLLGAVLAVGVGLAVWKVAALQEAQASSMQQHEPTEAIAAATATQREHRRTTTSIGTVLALRSITLQNELAGTVHEVNLTPGQIVEAGTVLVALDVSVEQAELRAQEAQAALTETVLKRVERARESQAVSEMEVDRARAEREVALAQIARINAIIARKTIRAPFRARLGISDVHVGQYLEEGTLLTTLQGVDDAAHVDFTVTQVVAAGLHEGDTVEVFTSRAEEPIIATVVAIDARVDPSTRNATVRAKFTSEVNAPAPGASVRVRVPVGPVQNVVVVPVSAVRKGPGGDHVFVIAPDPGGAMRAHMRPVQAGAMLGDAVIVHAGLAAGEQVATSGSFKLREGVLVAIAGAAADHAPD